MPRDLTKSFPSALFDYLRDFKAWKISDEARLVSRIKHALVMLYRGKMQLPPDEPEDSQLNTEFRTQICRLRQKMQQIAGPAMLSKFDEEHLGDKRSSAGGASLTASATHVLSVGHQEAVVPTDRMAYEQLAHELLLDPCFQLTDRGTCCESVAAQRVRQFFHKAFWESLAADLGMSCFVRVLRVLIEVRSHARVPIHTHTHPLTNTQTHTHTHPLKQTHTRYPYKRILSH